MARPRLQLDEKQIANYAKLGASNREIADMMGCDEGTIRGRFSALLTKVRAMRRTQIREYQMKAARAGNPAMLIWLGKNELDQTDKQILEHTGHDGGPVQHEVTHSFDADRFADLYRRRTGRNPARPGIAPADGN